MRVFPSATQPQFSNRSMGRLQESYRALKPPTQSCVHVPGCIFLEKAAIALIGVQDPKEDGRTQSKSLMRTP